MATSPFLDLTKLKYDDYSIGAFDVLLERLFPALQNDAALRADYAKCACLLADIDASVLSLSKLDDVLYDLIKKELADLSPYYLQLDKDQYVKFLNTDK